MNKRTLVSWLDHRFYPAFGHRWDDELLRQRILVHLQPDMDILDVGAGRGVKDQMSFRGHCRFVAGADVEPSIFENTQVDEAKLLEPPHYPLPYPDNRFDLVISNCVIEHVVDAGHFFCEIFRVLRPGAVFIAKTPNKWHYVATAARMTPHWFHDYYNRLRGRASRDTFPTTYVCNTKGALRRVAHEAGFQIERLEAMEGRPEYLRLAAPMYLAGIVYERTVNAWKGLEGFRAVWYLEFRKPRATSAKRHAAAARVAHERQSCDADGTP